MDNLDYIRHLLIGMPYGSYATTLEDFGWQPGRKVGNTTRQVDKAIQIIMSGKTCVTLDHHMSGYFHQENKRLFDLVMDRLCNEHQGLFRYVRCSRPSFRIWIEQPKPEVKRPRVRMVVNLDFIDFI